MNQPLQFVGEVVPSELGDSPVGLYRLREICPVDGCGEHLIRLLAVPSSSIGRGDGRWFYLDRCLNCNFFGDSVSYQYDSEGNIVWSKPVASIDVECLNLIEDQCRGGSKASIRWRVIRPDEVFDCAPPMAGAQPRWEQDAVDVRCPKCENVMEFILQLSSSGMDPRRDAMGFYGGCPPHRWAGTSIEGFEISIEHYATAFLFYCFDCEVATSLTQS